MGKPSNSASNAAERRQKEEDARITAGTQRVNAIFDGPERQQQYQDFLGAMRESYGRQLGEEKGKADLNNKFALARQGQYGGSVQRDRGVQLGKDYQKGLLEVERGSQESLSGIKSADQQSRNSLIGMIQSGLAGEQGASQAALQLQNNLQAGRATANVNRFGETFANFAGLYKNSKEQSEYRRGLKQGTSLYGQPAWGGT